MSNSSHPISPSDTHDKQEITVGDYVVNAKIGQGSFATVYKAQHKTTQRIVAIKSVSRSKLTKKLQENLESEISILKAIRHDHIVGLIECQNATKHIHLVMEYCSVGDLSQYIRRIRSHKSTRGPAGGLPEHVVRHFLKQLASALQFLRSENLVHRDIKPQNLLLVLPQEHPNPRFRDSEIPILKVADFGFARFLPNASLADTLCGSPLYMGPEILSYKKYDAKADLWSVGAVLYEMITGRPPFRAQNHLDLLKKIQDNGDRIRFPDEKQQQQQQSDPNNININNNNVSNSNTPNNINNSSSTTTTSSSSRQEVVEIGADLKDLIRKLLKKEPVERISFEEFFLHPAVFGTPESTETGGQSEEESEEEKGENETIGNLNGNGVNGEYGYLDRYRYIDNHNKAKDKGKGKGKGKSRINVQDTGNTNGTSNNNRIYSRSRDSNNSDNNNNNHNHNNYNYDTNENDNDREYRQYNNRQQSPNTPPSRSSSTVSARTPRSSDRPALVSKSRYDPASYEPPPFANPPNTPRQALERRRSSRTENRPTVNHYQSENTFDNTPSISNLGSGSGSRYGSPSRGNTGPEDGEEDVLRGYVVLNRKLIETNQFADDLDGRTHQGKITGSGSNAQHTPGTSPVTPPPIVRERKISTGPGGSALTKALSMASVRLFGFAHPPQNTSKLPLSRVGSPKGFLETNPDNGYSGGMMSEIEQIACMAHAVACMADSKYEKLTRGAGIDPNNNSNENYHQMAEEAYVLHIKSLALLEQGLDTARKYWTRVSDEQARLVFGRLNESVQWMRERFNECLDRASHEGSKIGDEEGSTFVQKLLYERALESSRAAAVLELVGEDFPKCEQNYQTAIWLLSAIMQHEEEGIVLEENDRRIINKFIDSIRTRISALRRKMKRPTEDPNTAFLL